VRGEHLIIGINGDIQVARAARKPLRIAPTKINIRTRTTSVIRFVLAQVHPGPQNAWHSDVWKSPEILKQLAAPAHPQRKSDTAYGGGGCSAEPDDMNPVRVLYKLDEGLAYNWCSRWNGTTRVLIRVGILTSTKPYSVGCSAASTAVPNIWSQMVR
jgi:hypothetical protein